MSIIVYWIAGVSLGFSNVLRKLNRHRFFGSSVLERQNRILKYGGM